MAFDSITSVLPDVHDSVLPCTVVLAHTMHGIRVYGLGWSAFMHRHAAWCSWCGVFKVNMEGIFWTRTCFHTCRFMLLWSLCGVFL